MKKENIPKEGIFKKLISSFWFWVGIWIFSYIIFVLIPIKWDESGYGWNTWEGTNAYRTIFAYLSSIAFAIAVIMLIVDIIKYIQKTSWNKYWKTSFTIIGIVLIAVFAFYQVRSLIPSESSNMETYTSDNFERLVTEDLTEMYGYEVINVGHYGEERNDTSVYLTMKSLGNIDNQAWDGLTSISIYSDMAEFPNVTHYSVTILTPTQECRYSIDGSIMRTLRDTNSTSTITLKGGEVVDGTTYYGRVKDYFQNSENCE
jgi:hypothetical protein